MSSEPNPDPDRKAARLPLRAPPLRLDPVTTPELLGKIHALLRDLDSSGKNAPRRAKAGAAFPSSGRSTEAATAAPALSLPEALRERSIAALGMAPQNPVPAPDPAPAATPPAAPSAPRRKIPRAALAAAGFLVLGATGLVVAQGPGLLHRLVTPARHSQARPAGGAEPVPIPRAAAPPARPAAIATRLAVPPPVAAPKEPAKNRPAAPARALAPRQNAGTAAPRAPLAAQARTAPPTATPATLPASEATHAAARPAHPAARHHRYRHRRRSRAREHRRYSR